MSEYTQGGCMPPHEPSLSWWSTIHLTALRMAMRRTGCKGKESYHRNIRSAMWNIPAAPSMDPGLGDFPCSFGKSSEMAALFGIRHDGRWVITILRGSMVALAQLEKS